MTTQVIGEMKQIRNVPSSDETLRAVCLSVAGFAVSLAFVLSQGGRVQALVAGLAAQA